MKKGSGFEKFMKGKPSGAALKEKLKQEKRAQNKERKAFFEAKRQEEAKAKRFEKDEPQPAGKKVQPIKIEAPKKTGAKPAQMPLNKYLAHGGISSRRDAAELVKNGKVKVNGEVATEPGYKVKESDVVTVNGKKITPTGNLVYILVNKPKDYITTAEDPQGRKTVLELIQGATTERIYPVGRLDRNTSGVLLLTNDGDLAQKLTHPSNEIKKVYAVTLDRPLEAADFEKIRSGVVLEDGPVQVDAIGYTDAGDKRQVGVELHSGRNRIVRRLFEHLKYDVRGLDRVVFAGLTKKNVPRGKWRSLNEKEVRQLKYFGKGK